MNLVINYSLMILSLIVTSMYLFGCIRDLKLDFDLVCRKCGIHVVKTAK